MGEDGEGGDDGDDEVQDEVRDEVEDEAQDEVLEWAVVVVLKATVLRLDMVRQKNH